jgi:beta-fructofuranosidase
VEDGTHLLLYNFYFAHGKIDALRVLPPPKEINADEDGRLFLTSYYRWEQMVQRTVLQKEIDKVEVLLSNPTASYSMSPEKWTFGSRVGYEIFCFQTPSPSYIWEGLLTVEGLGKLGLVCNIDKEGNGYFIAIDIKYGRTQIRAWGFNPLNNRQNFIFNNIQSGFFETDDKRSVRFKLISYGNYIELSINNVVILTLMDYTYSGGEIGVYTASSVISLENSIIKVLPDPVDEYASQKDAQIFT